MKSILKRDGSLQAFNSEKILKKNRRLCKDGNIQLTDDEIKSLSDKVAECIPDGTKTSDITLECCENALYYGIFNSEYEKLSSRIVWYNYHRRMEKEYSKVLSKLKGNKNKLGKPAPLISKEFEEFALLHLDEINKAFHYERDYNYSYYSFRVLEKSYLHKVNKEFVETMQHLHMRVALAIHGPSDRNGIHHDGDINKALKSYEMFSLGKCTHASPTLFHCGSNEPQLASCFIMTCPDSFGSDYTNEVSIQDIFKRCTHISRKSGGIGIDLTPVRPRGSYISGANGDSDGVLPLIQVFNSICRYVNQGGKRKGAIALYLQPWHGDIEEFLEMGLDTGSEEKKARDIFSGLMIPDLFFKRLEDDSQSSSTPQIPQLWSLFDSNKYSELITLYGDEFEERYLQLEREKKYISQIPISKLWLKIVTSLDQTGRPYMLAKDAINKKSNQKNIGTVTCSNLCTEIVEYHDKDNVAVCNLASIALPSFVKDGLFDYEEFGLIVRMLVDNLNLLIDKNYYPVKSAVNNNLTTRPIGIGIQGLGDVFALLKIAWDDKEAAYINRKIFEYLYYHAVDESANLASKYGSYDRFVGSPISQGILSPDMWEIEQQDYISKELDWDGLRSKVKKGVRNSLLIAPMPTASTSQIMGWNESFEPLDTFYMKKVLSGDFPSVNKHLVKDLKEIKAYTKDNITSIVKNNSVQQLNIPDRIKEIHKTVWEIPQKRLIDLAAERAPFIDQTMSFNIFMKRPTVSKLSSMYMYSWKKGLKTLSYYVRSKPAVDPIKVTLDKEVNEVIKGKKMICTDDVCTSCSS